MFSVRASERYSQNRSWAMQTAVLDRLANLPGVVSASAAQVVPLSGGLWTRDVQVEGYTFRAGESDRVGFNVIAPKYFATVGRPLASGREFDGRYTKAAPKWGLVNEGFDGHFF